MHPNKVHSKLKKQGIQIGYSVYDDGENLVDPSSTAFSGKASIYLPYVNITIEFNSPSWIEILLWVESELGQNFTMHHFFEGLSSIDGQSYRILLGK